MKEQRKKMGLTLDGLAQKCDSSKSYIWELEKGGIEPSLSKAFLIARALGVNIEYLCGQDKGIEQYAAEVGTRAINALTAHLDIDLICAIRARKATDD
jgi:transcriptional regulator with XRE-family HTH domain